MVALRSSPAVLLEGSVESVMSALCPRDGLFGWASVVFGNSKSNAWQTCVYVVKQESSRTENYKPKKYAYNL